MNEGSYSWRCVYCGYIAFWNAQERRAVYTCTCHTRQFKQPTLTPRTEVPQAFYDAFKEKNGEK